MNQIGNQYLKQVKASLTCPGKIKKRLLLQLQGDVAEFLETNPNAAMQDLVNRFGPPEQMAISYLANLDGDELQKQIRKSKVIKRIVMFTCIGILSIILIVASIIIIDNLTDDVSVVTYTVSEGETVITNYSEVPINEANNNYTPESTVNVVVQGTIEDVVEELVNN